MLKLLGRDTSVCDPRTLSNLSAVMFLLYNSHAKYLFSDRIEATVDVLLQAFHTYIYNKQTTGTFAPYISRTRRTSLSLL